MTQTQRAYSYIRFSTRDQIKGDSLRRQTEATAEWCKRHRIEQVESYQDLGMSARHGKNAATGKLSEFLALVRAGKIQKGSYLIVESLDRISRQEEITESFEIVLSMIRAGINLVTLSDGQIYDKEKINKGNFTGLIIALTVLSRGSEESKMKSQRVAAAWDQKRKAIAGGQKMTASCPVWLRLAEDRRTFELIPEKVATVRRIFELAAQGWGCQRITRTLINEKTPILGNRAKRWHLEYVAGVMRNRAAIGELTPTVTRAGEQKALDPIPDYYPAAVDKAVFATVQQLTKSRPSLQGRGAVNVFSKIAYDRETKTAMTYRSKGNSDLSYLVPRAALFGEAKWHGWNYQNFLDSFLEVCEATAETKLKEPAADNSKLEVARMDEDDCEQQIARLMDFLAKGLSVNVEAKLRELEARQAAIKQTIRDLEHETIAQPQNPAKVDWSDLGALRENIRATVRRIVVDNHARTFHVEFLTGAVYQYQKIGAGDEFSIEFLNGKRN